MRKISIVVGILNGAACTNSAIQRIDLERGAGSSSSQLLFIARENARSVNRSTESAMRQSDSGATELKPGRSIMTAKFSLPL